MHIIIVPEKVLLDGANGPHLAHLGPRANHLNAHVGVGLNDHVIVVGVLGRRRVRVPLDVRWDQLFFWG